MRIGIDVRTLMDKQYSGVPEYSYNLIKTMLKVDIGPGNSYKLFYNSARDISSGMPDFGSDRVEMVKTGYPNKIFNYLLQKNLHRPQIDKMLGVDVFFMPHINFISLSPETPSVITIHDLSFLRYSEFFSLRKNFWHQMINVKKLLNNFDTIVSVSQNTKNDIVELCGQDPEKIEVIYPGLSSEFQVLNPDNPGITKVKHKYGLGDDLILYVGTLEPRKNLETLLAAFDSFCQKFPDSNKELVVVGGRGWKSGQIDRVKKNITHSHKIKFLGYIPGEDKPYLYNSASIFVYPSFYEGFGFPPLEAMACGVPVISSFVSSLPEVLTDSALLIDPYNINELARYLEELSQNNDLRRKMIASGLTTAKKYTWENAAIKHLRLFQKLERS
jgi:glycosyltransferase involved in cell wall biosynthesis